MALEGVVVDKWRLCVAAVACCALYSELHWVAGESPLLSVPWYCKVMRWLRCAMVETLVVSAGSVSCFVAVGLLETA